jgi:hypothetical protein
MSHKVEDKEEAPKHETHKHEAYKAEPPKAEPHKIGDKVKNKDGLECLVVNVDKDMVCIDDRVISADGLSEEKPSSYRAWHKASEVTGASEKPTAAKVGVRGQGGEVGSKASL